MLKKTKVKRKPKKKSPTHYRKLCVARAKIEAKERDKGICQRCGKKVEGANAHGSHILNEGTYPLMSAEVYNIILLCYYDHINWWHKNPLEASEWFREKYPELYQTLKLRSQESKIINWEKKYYEMKEVNNNV